MNGTAVNRNGVGVLQNQSENKLRNGRSAVGGYVADGNALFFAVFPVNDIIACAEQANIFELRQGFEKLSAKGSFICYNDLATLCALGNKLGGGAVINGAFAAIFKPVP